jgi:hypothetical protein
MKEETRRERESVSLKREEKKRGREIGCSVSFQKCNVVSS